MTTESTDRSEAGTLLYVAYHVIEGRKRGQKPRWHRIGAFFAHEDGQGGTLLLDSLPITFDGRVVLRAPKVEEETGGAQ
jgi:hypothetical protein